VFAATTVLALVPWAGAAAAPLAQVNDLRVGEHPGATRIVLDISEPNEMTFDVSDDGRVVIVGLPGMQWSAGSFSPRHAKGVLRDYRTTAAADGSRLTLVTTEPVKLKAPFFLGPEGKQGHRVVLDIIPDIAAPAKMAMPATAAAPRVPPLPVNQPIAQTAPQALGGTMVLEPPSDVAMMRRADTSSLGAQAVVLTPGSAARPVETAQALPRTQPMPPQPMPAAQPMDRGPFGGMVYVKLGAGVSMLEEANPSGSGNAAAVETDLGWSVLGGIGVDLKNNFRIEGEAFYVSNDVSTIRGTANGATVNAADVNGSVSTLAFMANAAYDFTNAYAITPYIFGGAGLARVAVGDVSSQGNAGWDDSDWVFALQGGIGLALDVNDRLSLDLGYRYFETLELELSDARGEPFTYDNAMHLFLLSARYKF
jgi:opacity protein-like surface antigen